MLDLDKLARPYAEAAFDYAREQDCVPAWSKTLVKLADIVRNDEVNKFLHSPEPTSEQFADIMIDLTGGKLDNASKNFIKTLATNHRLLLLPEIARSYETLRAISARIIHVTVKSAVALTDAYKKELTAALRKKLDHEITLACDVDENLIGGLVIRAGDTVIDNSITGQLTRFETQLVG